MMNSIRQKSLYLFLILALFTFQKSCNAASAECTQCTTGMNKVQSYNK